MTTSIRTARGRPPLSRGGFSLLELMLVMGIVGVLAAMAVPRVSEHQREKARTEAILDIRLISTELMGYYPLPATLADIGRDQDLDPWGNPYQYVPIQGTGKGSFRKDKYLVPLNSDFDLYSMGPDGASVSPLTSPVSHDDIIRASNGGFVGLATEY